MVKMHSEKQIELWFKGVRDDSYSDLCSSSKVIIRDMGLMGYSSPFDGNVYINLNSLNRNKIPKKAVIGTLAHELAHQVSYRRRSFFSNLFLLWNYWLSEKKRSRVEMEADEIAVQRGYGKELLIEIESEYRCFSDDKKMLEFIKRVYPTPDDIKRLIKKYPRANK
jgi:hypothetical protein